MIRKIIILIFALISMQSTSISAQIRNVELFDIQEDKVTKTVPMSPPFQERAEEYLKNIDNIYVKVSPVPKKGYMIKIPLEPSVQVTNKWINSLVNEVIIVFPKDEEPFLMTFDNEDDIYVFTFKGNTDFLVKTFNLDLKNL
jgi:hypothetical protein